MRDDIIKFHECDDNDQQAGIIKYKGSLRNWWEIEVYDEAVTIYYCPFCGASLD